MPRERKPLYEHQLQNTKPSYDLGAEIPAGRPSYPKGVSREAKRAFKSLCRQLERRRVLTEGDGQLIRLYAITYDRHQRALDHLAAEGEVCLYSRLNNHGEEVKVEKPNLWLKVAQDSERVMIACLDRLGLSPINRGKVRPAKDPKAAPPEPDFPTREEAMRLAAEQEPDLSAINENTIIN